MTDFNFEMMAALLRETEQQHALAEKRLPKHEWQDWYAAYMTARMHGERVTRENSAKLADFKIRSLLQSAASGGVTIIDAPRTEVCDECGAEVPATGSMYTSCHEVSCSLHPCNVV